MTLIRMHSVTAAAVAVAAAMTRDAIAALLSASSSLQRGKERERERQEPSKKGSISARCSLESKEGNERRTDLTLPLKTARSGGRRMRKGGRTEVREERSNQRNQLFFDINIALQTLLKVDG